MIYAQADEKSGELLHRQLKEAKDAKWYRRLKIIELSSQGNSVPQLAEIFDVSQATVRDYIKRYNQGGLEALKRSSSPGRAAKIKLTKEQWQDLLHRSPSQFDKLNTAARNWRQELLRQYCCLYLGINLGQSTISTILRKLGIRYNRGKLKVTSPDPLYSVKRERVETLKKRPARDS